MRDGRSSEKCKNGRGCINGKVGDGTYQETSKYIGNLEGSLLGTREGIESTIGHAQYFST